MDDGVSVELVHCGHDAVLEFLFGSHADVAQNGAGEFGEETLDQVEPGAVLGGKGELEAALGLGGEPCFRLLGDVCGMVVEDQLASRSLRNSTNSRPRCRSLTRAWTLPVSKSMALEF